MDTGEVELIRSSFESTLRQAEPADVVALLGKLGWDELRQADPRVAVAELFEAQGRVGAASAALDVVVAEALGAGLDADQALVHPAPGGRLQLVPAGRWDGAGGVAVDGLLLAGPARAARLLIPVADDGTGDGAVELVEVEPDALALTPVQGSDPTLGLVRVQGCTAATRRRAVAAHWAAAARVARRALAHELVGLAEEMLDTAARHVTHRHQFGKPIAAFQVVRHRLTEVHVALASTRPVLDAAWATGDGLAADAAKVLAGRAAAAAATHCLQVTGAIGFTAEYGLHHQIRRGHVLDALYGSARVLQTDIGARLLAARTVPRLRPLP